MPDTSFRAMVVEETAEGNFSRQIQTRKLSDLPKGEVLIKVDYSSLNYKDALSASGNKGVTRRYPHTPGIDAAGTVAASEHAGFSEGDPVLVTGYDLGMNTDGGFGQYVRVPADWVVPRPAGLSAQESMALGTAGFTAALGVGHLIHMGVTPDKGPVLVTGASGGVGSIAVGILAHRGYAVTASSGKTEAAQMLTHLGAAEVIDRLAPSKPDKPLLPQRWAGVIDTVGGDTLSIALRSTLLHGTIACCGNVASANLDITVYPFILRGIALIGMDSATTEMDERRDIWDHLADEWKFAGLASLATTIGLDDLDDHIEKILDSRQMGRKVVDLNA